MGIRVIWEGQLPLENVVWQKHLNEAFRLPKEWDSLRITNWNRHVKKNPKDYDGELVFLRQWEFKDGNLILQVGSVHFSTIIFLLNNMLPITRGFGVLGVQALIFSPCHRYILVGERSLSQLYCPGLTTVPGGLLEVTDLEWDPTVALMREVHEEISLPLRSAVTLHAIVFEHSQIASAVLLSGTITDSYTFDPYQRIPGENEEWESNLRLIPADRLLELPDDTLFDGLLYFKSKLLENPKFHLDIRDLPM